MRLLQALRSRARDRGVRLVTGEVVGMAVDRGRIVSVALADGTTIPCGSVVNAAGPWARSVAALAGVDLPVEARRRSVFVFDAPGGAGRLPTGHRHVGGLVSP